MIPHRFARLLGAILLLAPSLAFGQAALQQPCFDASKCKPADNIGLAVSKLYANDLYLQSVVNSPLPQVVALQAQLAALQSTVGANSGATAGTYGSGSVIPVVTVDARGRITGIGTVAAGQPSIGAGTISANLTGASAPPSGSTLSAILDSQIGATRATIAVRGASTWGALTPATSGCTFQFNGTDTVCASASPGTGAVRYDASQGLTSAQQAQGRNNIAGAASGANSDITALSGLSTPLSVAQGGTGGGTAAAARSSIGSAASGANSDITSLSGLTTPLSVAQGGTGATTSIAMPPGAVMSFATSSCPSGWLPRNGAAISRTTYAALFSAISTTYGTGDGSTTFAVPDDRGLFVRNLDSGKGIDASRALGSAQGDTLGPIADTFNFNGNTLSTIQVSTNASGTGSYTGTLTMGDGSSGYTLKINPTGGAETRPKNIAFLGCIKF